MNLYEISGRSLARLVAVSLFAGMAGGFVCALLAMGLWTAYYSDRPLCQLIPLIALLLVTLFGLICYWGIVSRRHLRRFRKYSNRL